MVVADDSYFRIQTRQPSASKLQKGTIIVKASGANSVGTVSSLERNTVKYQTSRKPGVSVLRDRKNCKLTTEYSCAKSSLNNDTDELNQVSVIQHDRTFTKSVLGSSSMNCGSEDVSPQITRLPTASKLITNPMGVLNQAKEDYRHLKLDQLLANIENIPPAPNFQGFSHH